MPICKFGLDERHANTNNHVTSSFFGLNVFYIVTPSDTSRFEDIGPINTFIAQFVIISLSLAYTHTVTLGL